jgi:hypothetical protein
MRIPVIATLLLTLFQSQSPALRIVVLEGEGAVNIIQQKTAVRPLVEVRDRNNLPVAGATVTFTIGGGQPAAFAAGAQTLTVTTNAAGQAAASGFNVLGSGALNIQVQAAYQGQIATAAIAQTNVATAAAASQAAAQAATSGAGGAGGGISATTIAVVGGAVAGGAVVATQVAGGGDSTNGKTYSADFSGPMTVTFSNSGGTCVQQRAVKGSLKIVLDETGDKAMYSVTAPTTSDNGNFAVCPQGGLNPGVGGEAAVASRTNPSFTATSTQAGSPPITFTFEFAGTQSGDTITGTFKYTETFPAGGGTVSFPLTLR